MNCDCGIQTITIEIDDNATAVVIAGCTHGEQKPQRITAGNEIIGRKKTWYGSVDFKIRFDCPTMDIELEGDTECQKTEKKQQQATEKADSSISTSETSSSH